MSAPGFPMPASPQPLAPTTPHDPTAVMGPRVVAGLIDALLFFLVMLLVSPGPLSPLAEYAEKDEDLSQEEACDLAEENADADPNLCFAVGDRVYWLNEDDRPIQAGVYFGYIALYILLQGLTGFTPGKLLLGLRAVGADGQKPGIGRSFLRTLLWIVDGFPYCLPLVGLITAISSTGHRRLGDMVGGTYVVGKGDAGRPVSPGPSPGDHYLAGGYPSATAPYGTPATGFPAAPPYHAPSQPQAGAWGAPPAGPTPGWGAPPSAPSTPPAAPDTATFPASPSDAATPDVTFGAGADPASFEAAAAEPPATTEGPRASEAPATSSETPAAEAEGTSPTEPTPTPGTATEAPGVPSDEAAAKAEAASAALEEPAATTPQQADSPYQPQWDAARGAYIQWDPNRSRWLQWDDNAKEWNPI